jgi:hypothetical protein
MAKILSKEKLAKTQKEWNEDEFEYAKSISKALTNTIAKLRDYEEACERLFILNQADMPFHNQTFDMGNEVSVDLRCLKRLYKIWEKHTCLKENLAASQSQQPYSYLEYQNRKPGAPVTTLK